MGKYMMNTNAPLRTSLLLIGAGLVTISLFVLQALPVDQRKTLLWISVVGVAMFLSSAVNVISNKSKTSRVEQIIQQIAAWFHLEDWQTILLLSSPLLSWMAWRAAGEGRTMINPVLAVLTWLVAIAAATIGSIRISRGERKIEPRAFLLPLVLTLTAFLMRGLAMDRFPILLTGDEGSAGLTAVQVLKGEINNPFISAGYSFPSLYYCFQAVSIGLLGQTTLALRLTSAIAGALTVTALFYVGSIMFDRRSGLLAAIFLTAYGFHLHFSRIGLNNIWDGLWYIIFIGALWHGWEHEQNRSFTIAGVTLGLAQYFYPSGRALIIPILGWLFLMAILNREKFKRMFFGILITFTVASVIILPLALYYWHHPDEFLAPFIRVSLFGPILDNMVQSSGKPAWLIVVEQIWKSLQGFIYLPLTSWYQPGTPLLRPFAASLFAIGFLLLFTRLRDSRSLLLALWILTFGLIGGLSESTPAAQRYVAAAPVCALLIGYGLSETASLLEQLWPQLTRVMNGVILAIAVLIAADELNFYFNTYTQKTVVDWSHNNGMIVHRLIPYLKEKPADTQVVFMGAPSMGYYSIPSLQFLAPDIKGIDASLPWGSFDKSLVTADEIIFVFLPGNEGALEAVKKDYPDGQTFTEIASDGKPLYWYYEYSAE